MNINNIQSCSFGILNKDAYYPDYSYDRFIGTWNQNDRMNAIYAKLLEIEENQRILSQNQQAIQDANRNAFNSFDKFEMCSDSINQGFEYNKINLIA